MHESEERSFSQKINIDCTNALSRLYAKCYCTLYVQCDGLTYLPIGYFTWYVLASSSASSSCSHAPLLLGLSYM